MTAAKPAEILSRIAEENGLELTESTPLSGGDINSVYLLETASSENLVLKLNRADRFPGIFDAEAAGLKILRETGSIDVPEVKASGNAGTYAYLLMEYRKPGTPAKDFSEIFGRQLASLHRHTANKFGFPEEGYIGSLPQPNSYCETAVDFYISQRLQPQLKMAEDRNYDLKVPESFFRNISHIIPNEAPALIHGDLWSGNYLVNAQGLPCLIDPATAYAPREMDLGMMKLFGGFDRQVFDSYAENFPLQPGHKERIPLWQLYYILVHLNIFGTAYRERALNIIRQFS